MLTAAWNIWLELAPWLLLGAAVAGLLHAVLPAGFMNRRLSGRRGVLNAVLLGVPLPLCSCGVIPTGLGLKKQGAGDGATVGFLISTPQTGVDSVLVTTAFLGLPFALFKVACAAVTGLVGGWLAEAASDSSPQTVEPTEHEATPTNKLRAAADHAVELIRSIWLWIVIGVILSAAITAWLPTDGLSALDGYGGLLGMAAALVISLPLYVCATASVPIAASLVVAGLPAGAAMVFLMAGPATNIATIGAVYRVLGARQLAIYLATIIVGSVAGGLLFGWMIDTPIINPLQHTHATPWWSITCGAVLFLMFAWFAIDDTRRLLRNQPAGNGTPTQSIAVEGMTCGSCVAKLEKALAAEPGVSAVRVTLNPGRAEITGDVTSERLRTLVREAGFSAR